MQAIAVCIFCFLSYFPFGDNILYSFPYFWVNLFLLQYRGEESVHRSLLNDIAVGDVYMDVIHEYPDLTVHLTLFEARITKGEPQLLEHNAIAWITPSETDRYEFCPADREILDKIKGE